MSDHMTEAREIAKWVDGRDTQRFEIKGDVQGVTKALRKLLTKKFRRGKLVITVSGNNVFVGQAKKQDDILEAMSRDRLLKNWLRDLTPEKVDLIGDLERGVRLLNHVKTLTGDVDPKLLEKLFDTSKKIKDWYERDEIAKTK